MSVMSAGKLAAFTILKFVAEKASAAKPEPAVTIVEPEPEARPAQTSVKQPRETPEAIDLRTSRELTKLLSSGRIVEAEQLLASMALGLMKNPEGMGFPGSRNLQQYPSAHNAEIISGTGMHWGVVAALIAVIFAYIVLSRHMFGFSLRMSGMAPRAARFAGVNPTRMVLICMGISGGLAGMAGLFEIAGPAGQVSIDFNVGYGFTAIIVAFLGRLNPIGILLAGVLMALTYIGGEITQSQMGLPLAAIQVFQGMLLFFLLAMDLLTNYRFRPTAKEAA